MAVHMFYKGLRFYNPKRGILCHLNSLRVNNEQCQNRITPQWINVSGEKNYSDIINNDAPCTVKKKNAFVPRISLLSENNDMSIVTLEEAQKIAKRRDLKLIKIIDFDTKSERATYQLMSMRDFLQTEAKNKAAIKEANNKIVKEEKTISISSKIADHDLNTKIKSMHKMLRKRHGVRALISIDDNIQKATKVAEHILSESKDIAIVTKTQSGFTIKITLRPIVNIQKTNEKTEENKDLSKDNTK